jgi:selenocysteine lyase/cysteine desulfurase
MNNMETSQAFSELRACIETALKTYSNVHRGSGHFSEATTFLYEHARDIIADFLGLDKRDYVVIFCSPGVSSAMISKLDKGSFSVLSSEETGLPLGVRAVVVRRNAIKAVQPPVSGGGTTRLISPDWIVWADAPERFEAGTPSVINIIAFVKSLQLIKKYGKNIFENLHGTLTDASQILYEDEFDNISGIELLDQLRKKLIGYNTIVPTCEGERRYINLDNAASTSTFSPVWDSVFRTWKASPETQKMIVGEVRKICSDFIEAPLTLYDIIFTTNTTESINIVARNLSVGSSDKNGPVIINSIMEHNSNDLPWRSVPGSSILRLGIDENGFIDLVALEKLLKEYNNDGLHGDKRVSLVAICGASNVLGTFNDLGKIAGIAHSYNARILVDAAQLIAHSRVLTDSWDIDYLVFSAHKAYAPFGSGVLVARKGLMKFSMDELNLINSSGEENVGGIAALGKALLLLKRVGIDIIKEEERKLTELLISSLTKVKGITIFGIHDSGLIDSKAGILVINIKGKMAHQLAREISYYGIGVRYGCHCAHILIKSILNLPLPLQRFQHMLAILFKGMKFPGLLRVSIGIGNTSEDINEFVRILSLINSSNTPKSKTVIKHKIEDFVAKTDVEVFS